MSCKIKTLTPFTNQSVLKRSLDKLGIKYSMNGQNIVLDIEDYFGNKVFEYKLDQYQLSHDSDNYGGVKWENYKNDDEFLKDTEKTYRKIALAKGIQADRGVIEAKKMEIIERAKAQGYQVKERKVGEKVKLVLTRK